MFYSVRYIPMPRPVVKFIGIIDTEPVVHIMTGLFTTDTSYGGPTSDVLNLQLAPREFLAVERSITNTLSAKRQW